LDDLNREYCCDANLLRPGTVWGGINSAAGLADGQLLEDRSQSRITLIHSYGGHDAAMQLIKNSIKILLSMV